MSLSVRHAPVRFVNFGVEWPSIVDGDRLCELLPGTQRNLDTTHYLSTEDWRRVGLMIGDTSAARSLAATLEGLRQGLLGVERATRP